MMLPRAYSSAQHLSGILYCFATPAGVGGRSRMIPCNAGCRCNGGESGDCNRVESPGRGMRAVWEVVLVAWAVHLLVELRKAVRPLLPDEDREVVLEGRSWAAV